MHAALDRLREHCKLHGCTSGLHRGDSETRKRDGAEPQRLRFVMRYAERPENRTSDG
jgi:hypothetical protein